MKESIKLKQEGKRLGDYDPAKENELLSYLALLEEDTFWNSRKDYLQILELFVNNKLTLDEFLDRFSDIRYSNFKAADMRIKNLEDQACNDLIMSSEIDVQWNPKSFQFVTTIDAIYNYIDLLETDLTLEMNLKDPKLAAYGISEGLFRLDMERYFLPEIREYFKQS